MERILVIGSSGLLGSTFVGLAEKGYEVVGADIAPRGKAMRLDATDREGVFKIVQKVKPSFIVDTHSITDVDYCETHLEEAWRVNVEATKNVAEAAKTIGCKLAFISTDYVHDGEKTAPYNEKDKPHPLNYYGKTKLIAEKVIEALDMDHIIARTAILFGSGGEGKVPFPAWLSGQLRSKREVRIVVDQYNNPTLVDNLSAILLDLYRRDKRGLFNISGRNNLSRYDFAIKIAEMMNLDKKLIRPITTPELNQPAKRPHKVNLDVSKVENATSIRCLGIDDALKEMRGML